MNYIGRQPSRKAVIEAVERAPGPASVEWLRAELGLPRRTLQRHLAGLLAEGRIERLRHGVYGAPSRGRGLGEMAETIVETLGSTGADAHLTGFDPLVPYAHQFVYEFPHLVYCDPQHASTVEWELARAGYVVTPAGPGAQYAAPEIDRVVVLREQPDAEARYGIVKNVAPPEKAWVDLVREVRRSRMPFQWSELGRILRGMERAGCDMRRLRSYATRAGYLAWVRAARGEGTTGLSSAAAQALAVGYGEA